MTPGKAGSSLPTGLILPWKGIVACVACPGEFCPLFPHPFPPFPVCNDEHIWVSFPAFGLIGLGGGGLSQSPCQEDGGAGAIRRGRVS